MYIYIYIIYCFRINFPGKADRIQFTETAFCCKLYPKIQIKYY